MENLLAEWGLRLHKQEANLQEAIEGSCEFLKRTVS